MDKFLIKKGKVDKKSPQQNCGESTPVGNLHSTIIQSKLIWPCFFLK